MLKQFIKRHKLLLCVLLSCCVSATAKQSDKDAPIKIWADTFVADKKDNLAIYKGNVIFEQGTIKVACDQLKIVYQEQAPDEIDYIVMQAKQGTGNVAQFTQIDDNGKQLTASAKKIEYRQTQDKATFTGNAELQQNNNIFKAESMLFNTRESRLITNKIESDSKKNRVFISIKPEKK